MFESPVIVESYSIYPKALCFASCLQKYKIVTHTCVLCIITTFLFKMMSAIKSGVVSHSRFAKMAERDFKVKFKSYFKSRESDLDGICICAEAALFTMKDLNIFPSVETKTERISGKGRK